jgi:hypothetical protein
MAPYRKRAVHIHVRFSQHFQTHDHAVMTASLQEKVNGKISISPNILRIVKNSTSERPYAKL